MELSERLKQNILNGIDNAVQQSTIGKEIRTILRYLAFGSQHNEYGTLAILSGIESPSMGNVFRFLEMNELIGVESSWIDHVELTDVGRFYAESPKCSAFHYDLPKYDCANPVDTIRFLRLCEPYLSPISCAKKVTVSKAAYDVVRNDVSARLAAVRRFQSRRLCELANLPKGSIVDRSLFFETDENDSGEQENLIRLTCTPKYESVADAVKDGATSIRSRVKLSSPYVYVENFVPLHRRSISINETPIMVQAVKQGSTYDISCSINSFGTGFVDARASPLAYQQLCDTKAKEFIRAVKRDNANRSARRTR
jgi:hypothetical protein